MKLSLVYTGMAERLGTVSSSSAPRRTWLTLNHTALQTAISLADYEADEKGKEVVTIKRTHLERIVAISASFQKYIASMYNNKPDAFIAKKNKLRNDYYKETPISGRKQDHVTEEEEEIFTSTTRAPGRDSRKSGEDDEEDIQQRNPNGHKANVKRSSRAASTDRAIVLRSRSGQPKQLPSRMMTTADEDSERAAPKARRRTKQFSRSEEEESDEEALKTKNRSKQAPRSEEEGDSEGYVLSKTKKTAKGPAKLFRDETPEEEESLKPSRLSRTSTTAIRSRETDIDEEDEEVLEQETPRLTDHNQRTSRSYTGNGKRNDSESRSPGWPRRDAARRRQPAISEGEKE